jgi:hypothetical protein
MRIVNEHLATKARMLPPDDCGYLLLAAEVDPRARFQRHRPAKRQLLAHAKAWSLALAKRADVVEATVFRAVLVAPGEGTKLLKARAGRVHHARYDVVILLRTTSVQAAQALRNDPDYTALAQAVAETASYTMQIVARNTVRLGDVDHRPDHVFLFNYFYADDDADLIPVFAYTAGWFQAKTGLPNSTLLQRDHQPRQLARLPRVPAQPDLPADLPQVRAGQLRRQPHRRPAHPVPACVTRPREGSAKPLTRS